MEGLAVGVKPLSLSNKSVLPPINSGRKNSFGKNGAGQSNSAQKRGSVKQTGKPETSPRITVKSQMMQIQASNTATHNEPSAVTRKNEGKHTSPNIEQPGKLTKNMKPTKMHRAKQWSPDVENAYRFQSAGFRDYYEYIETYPPPEVWPDNGFVRQLQVKATGYHMYFRQTRECEDRYLGKTKLYTY